LEELVNLLLVIVDIFGVRLKYFTCVGMHLFWHSSAWKFAIFSRIG